MSYLTRYNRPAEWPLGLVLWLGCCGLMVLGMLVLGGAVRLTGSGLSIVDWQPFTRILPPLTDAEWLRAFERYKQFPEFRLLNQGMSLLAFKFIFLMEYAHRILGQLVGVVFLLPLIVVSVQSRYAGSFKLRLWLIFLLGGLQGLVGWYMVKSGLIDQPAVSQYRLVAHLLLGVLIYILILRTLLGLVYAQGRQLGARRAATDYLAHKNYLAAFGWATLFVLLLMFTSGGFVAALKAGLIYNTYPKMAADWLPAMLLELQPWWLNLFENPILIQFIHRWLAIFVLAMVVLYTVSVCRCDRRALARTLAVLMAVLAFVQVGVGIMTLIQRVPVWLGIVHQSGGIVLLTSVVALWCLYLPAIKWLPRPLLPSQGLAQVPSPGIDQGRGG